MLNRVHLNGPIKREGVIVSKPNWLEHVNQEQDRIRNTVCERKAGTGFNSKSTLKLIPVQENNHKGLKQPYQW